MTVLALLEARLNRVLPELPAKITRHTPTPIMTAFKYGGQSPAAKERQWRFGFLKGQIAAVEITDLNFKFSMTLVNRRIQISIPAQTADATLKKRSGFHAANPTAKSTQILFFRRKLLITGDTELGLYQNLIDTIDLTSASLRL